MTQDVTEFIDDRSRNVQAKEERERKEESIFEIEHLLHQKSSRDLEAISRLLRM
jgi:hypothetical protein